MVYPASSLIDLIRFPLARYLFVLEQVRDRARVRDLPAIGAAAEYAIVRIQGALDFDHRQRALRPTRYPAEAREFDLLVDATVVGLYSYCESQMDLFRGEERAAAAARLRQALLPDGVGSITRLPYADEHKQIDALLARAEAADLAADMAMLPEMSVILGRMRDVNAQYGQILRDTGETLTRADVRARHDECQDLLCGVVGLILGHFVTLPERHADRDYLLDPILREDAALRERRRRRRASGDPDDGIPDEIPPGPGDETGPTTH
jgi:hypothetical protein